MLRGVPARMGMDTLRGLTRRKAELTGAFKKLLGAYLMGTSLFVAAWFVVNPFFDAQGVWDVANYLMAVALAAALVFNARRRFEDGAGENGGGPHLRSLTANLCLYLAAGVALLFFRNWFLEIAGADGDDPATGLVWIVVNVLFPLTAGAAGAALWRE